MSLTDQHSSRPDLAPALAALRQGRPASFAQLAFDWMADGKLCIASRAQFSLPCVGMAKFELLHLMYHLKALCRAFPELNAFVLSTTPELHLLRHDSRSKHPMAVLAPESLRAFLTDHQTPNKKQP